MISKKRMRERVKDVFAGAGLIWNEDIQYFDDFCLESLGKAIIGLEAAFNLPDNTRLRTPWRLNEYDDIDTVVNLVREAIEYDT